MLGTLDQLRRRHRHRHAGHVPTGPDAGHAPAPDQLLPGCDRRTRQSTARSPAQRRSGAGRWRSRSRTSRSASISPTARLNPANVRMDAPTWRHRRVLAEPVLSEPGAQDQRVPGRAIAKPVRGTRRLPAQQSRHAGQPTQSRVRRSLPVRRHPQGSSMRGQSRDRHRARLGAARDGADDRAAHGLLRAHRGRPAGQRRDA